MGVVNNSTAGERSMREARVICIRGGIFVSQAEIDEGMAEEQRRKLARMKRRRACIAYVKGLIRRLLDRK